MARRLELSGRWLASPAGEALRRAYPDPGFDDRAWEPISVPGHWRSSAAFADTDGPVLHRHRFALPHDWSLDIHRRAWLVFDGIFYTSDVWLDGTYVGDTEGYFFPHGFEVTEALSDRDEHLVALEVACAPQRERTRKRNLTGVFQHWDLVDERWNPGGIWRPVRLEQSGPVRLRHLRVICSDARDDQATVRMRAVLDTLDQRTVEMRTKVYGPDGAELLELSREHSLAEGENRLEWTVAIREPQLWWPWSLGAQPQYRFDVEVRTDEVESDRRTRRVGLRRVEMRNWVFSVNGERMFLKGSNQGPTRFALGAATEEELVADVRLARQAGLDLLRIHGHVSRSELYDAADDQGMLLWQDLPLQWGYARSVRGQARRQAREAVDLLGHHPSVVVWCGHNEPLAIDMGPDTVGDPRRRRRLAARALVGQLLPSWNKSVLDHSVAVVLQKCDRSRPVVPHSGVLPHPPQLDGTDSHLYFGWYWGDERDLAGLARWWPRLVRFVGEFGAQAVPDDAEFLEPERWPDLDWERAARRHGLQRPFFDRYVPPAEHPSFAAWQQATQAYQADLIRHHIETLRRLKYRPCGGFAQFCFADSAPGVTWSVLDHARRPKLGFEALRRACAPVVIVSDRPPALLPVGARLRLDIHAVSDLRIGLPDMVATAHLSWSQDGSPRQTAWRWAGTLPPDSSVRVGGIDSVVPATTGPLTLELLLRAADGEKVADNRYELHVT